jgi:methyl-accepting chemotaxis protein
MNMSLKKQLGVMAVIAIVSVILLVVMAYLMATNSSIGSTKYKNILHANELTADILPPPLFMVEAMMKVETLARTDVSARAGLAKEIKQHFEDYEERVGHWKNSDDISSEIKEYVTGK